MQEDGVVLRTYRSSDLEAIFRLDEVCFAMPFRFSRAAMRRFAEAPNALTVIAEEGDAVVGFCIVHVEERAERFGYVVTLDVAPERRRMGIAGRLMEWGESQAETQGCRAMMLHVFVRNEEAIRFYERRGFVRAGRSEAFYGRGLDALIYRKALAGG